MSKQRKPIIAKAVTFATLAGIVDTLGKYRLEIVELHNDGD